MVTFNGNFFTSEATSEIVIRGPNISDGDYTLSCSARDHIISSSLTSEVTSQDSIFIYSSNAVVDRECRVNIDGTSGFLFDNKKEFVSLDEDVATVDSEGNVTRVSDGNAEILVKSSILNKKLEVEVYRDYIGETYEFIDFETGSLAKHCMEQVSSRTGEKDPIAAIPLFSTINNTTPSYIRNVNSWLYGVDDMTCLAVAIRSSSTANWTQYKGGTLVSPRHYVCCNHWPITTGYELRFLGTDNVLYTRTVTGWINVARDLVVGVLDEDLPSTVHYAKVLPTNYLNYIPKVSRLYADNVLGFGICHSDSTPPIGKKLASVRGFQKEWYRSARMNNEFYGVDYDWFRGIIRYDSGSPAFLIINGELVVLCTWSTGVQGSGTSISYYHDETNAAMTTLGGGYQLTDVDLSEFTDYSD